MKYIVIKLRINKSQAFDISEDFNKKEFEKENGVTLTTLVSVTYQAPEVVLIYEGDNSARVQKPRVIEQPVI